MPPAIAKPTVKPTPVRASKPTQVGITQAGQGYVAAPPAVEESANQQSDGCVSGQNVVGQLGARKREEDDVDADPAKEKADEESFLVAGSPSDSPVADGDRACGPRMAYQAAGPRNTDQGKKPKISTTR